MIARLLAFLRRVFPGNPAEPIDPKTHKRSLIDWAFVQGSFRPGERVDPTATTLEE